MTIRVVGTDLHVLNMHARLPFRYGIVTMTALPHLFVRAELEVDGRRSFGLAADGLPPKWFTKNPDTSFRDDLAQMVKVITTACDIARAEPKAPNLFTWWRSLYDHQRAWAGGWGLPGLLSGFGSSLVERAVIDAFCRAENVTFARAVREDRFGIDLGRMHPELEGAKPRDLLPAEPLRTIVARHTVGLTDALTDAEVPEAERVDDGLPQSLEACVRAYGLTHFKIKLWGDVAKDVERVTRVAEVIGRATGGGEYAYTLDGNENFKQVEAFRAFWESLTRDPKLSGFLGRLIFVEQPLHRDVAMGAAAAEAFAAWRDRPPTIIDESDGEIGTSRAALACGYVGTSHKNCKGVFKGLANACLIEHRQRAEPGGRYVLSGEDLCNVGPVALPQDLAALASFGVTHAERNGHHYFRGLSMYPADVQESVLQAHGDLYARHERGFATLNVQRGAIRVGSVVDAPFGVGFHFDPSRFTPLSHWTFDSLSPSS